MMDRAYAERILSRHPIMATKASDPREAIAVVRTVQTRVVTSALIELGYSTLDIGNQAVYITAMPKEQ
jgi:hypothetical protein